MKALSPNYRLVKVKCFLITSLKVSLHHLSVNTCLLLLFPCLPPCLLHLFTLHIVPLKYIFFKLSTLISHASSLLLSFLVLHSCYLTVCLHFSSILLLTRLLLSCSLSLSLACMVGIQAYMFVCLCVWVCLTVCVCAYC